mgnify:CR=1 FL=1
MYNLDMQTLISFLIESDELVIKMTNLFRDFCRYLNFFIIAAIIVFIFLAWYYLLFLICAFKKPIIYPTGETKYKYAVLVPARNEDKVIRNCLDSLKKQDYPKDKFDVYVIIESKSDPTYRITMSYGSNFHVIVRKHLTNRRTKGFALDEAFHYIEDNGLVYDALMIFDADNVVSPNYITIMNNTKNAGFQIATGYRNFTNATVNRVSSCSAILFSFMNNFTSNGRSRLFKKCTLTGTGYYIDYNIVKNEGGWIWNGMTEDVELTCYSYYHNISMTYNQSAVYYDEQATQYHVLHKQHVRWVWGFFASKKRFKQKTFDYGCNKGAKKSLAKMEYNFSIYPFVALCIVELLACLLGFALFISDLIIASLVEPGIWADASANPQTVFCWFLLSFFYLYFLFMLASSLTFIIDNKRLKFSGGKIVVCIFSYLFFFMDFLLAFFDGLNHPKKRKSWDKIEHSGDVANNEAIKKINEKKKSR